MNGETFGKQQFGTYVRDSTASAQDYADQRYYSNVYGRFFSPDPSGGSMDFRNPTSLNRYAYVHNDPVNNNDPTGLCLINGEEFPDPCFEATGMGEPWMWIGGRADGRYYLLMPEVENTEFDGGGGGGGGAGPDGVQRAKDATRMDLAKKDCYTLLGFDSAGAAQEWFDNGIKFHDDSYGSLQLQGGGPSATTPPPASTMGAGQININRDYNWSDFSKVTTAQGGTYDYLAYWNNLLNVSMTSDQLGALITVHELEHNRPQDAKETLADRLGIYNGCIK